MPDWMKLFFAFAAISSGLVLCLFHHDFPYQDPLLLILGVLLIAGGATYLWISRFHKRP
jgi:hypothetical protein